MSVRVTAALIVIMFAWSPNHAAAQGAPAPATQRTALIGLARTARDQGRYGDAVRHFHAASRLRAFDTPLLVEYFWAAQRADATVARLVGQQILRANPTDTAVREGLIGVLVGVYDEAAVRSVAQDGIAADPRAAVWPRRLAESFLRAGDGARAADHFKKASTLVGGAASDRAMFALALECTTDKAAAARAWSEVSETVWSSRPEWVESRSRAIAAVAPTAVARARPVALPTRRRPARKLTPDEIVTASREALAADVCAPAPLAVLEQLADAEAFIAAVLSRPRTCADHAAWAARAGERAIGLGRFADALRVVAPAAVADGAPLALRAQHAVLLHWTDDDERAEPLLRAVVAEASAPGRAIEALIDVLRVKGLPDEAWPLALDRWGHAHASADRRVAVASLALETGRLDEALARAQALEHDSAVGAQARLILVNTLLESGRPVEAKNRLGGLVLEPNAALLWLDAVAATEGIAAALRAAQPVSNQSGRPWVDVMARRAVWHAQIGERHASQRILDALQAVDDQRASLAAAEVALATGRPADAVSGLRELTTNRLLEYRAKDLLSTALAEQGRWDDAFAALAELRQRRPHDLRLIVREVAWRDRRAPSAATLATLESLVTATPAVGDGPLLLARAYVRAGQYRRAWAVLPDSSSASVEARLLRAEIAAATSGVAAADTEFEALTSGDAADPAWYLAWADLHKRGAGERRVLDRAAQRFPSDPLLQERLAVTAWAARDRDTARRAADAALASDQRRMGAWFVKIAGTRGQPNETAELVGRFEQLFSDSPTALLGMGDVLSALAPSAQDPAALQALGWATRIRAEQPSLGAAVVTQVRLLAAVGQHSRAMSEIDGLVRRQPTLPEAHKLRAELLAGVGRYAQAVAAYDQYLVLAPGDMAARRQQARVDGWRGATTAALARYGRLMTAAPDVPAITAEAAAKRAYYSGRWRDALAYYDAWLALEPGESEAQLERAQSLDHLGRTALAAQAYHGLSSEHRVAMLAAERLERRRALSVDLFTVGTSADGVSRRQLLDLVDAGAGFSTGIGAGHSTRVRVFGGSSLADAGDRDWQGHHVGGELAVTTASPIDLGGQLAYRKLGALDAQLFGDVRVSWKALQGLRLTVGAERSLILENGSTIVSGLAGVGPTGRLRWQPNGDLSIEVAATHLVLNDDNRRDAERADLSQRVWGRSNELRLVASTEHQSYAQVRESYFTPGRFWRHDAGVEWRGWLATPRFYGDRERWVSAAYLFGTDNRRERYHTARVGVAYEFAGGIGVVADGLLVRSRVYDGARASIGLRLKHVPTPVR